MEAEAQLYGRLAGALVCTDPARRSTGLVASGIEAQRLDKPGGIFVRRPEQVSQEDRVPLYAMSRMVRDAEGLGSLTCVSESGAGRNAGNVQKMAGCCIRP